jgi:hypothetical protein
MVVAVGGSMSVATPVGVMGDVPSKDVRVPDGAGIAVVRASVDVTTGSWSARAPARNAARRPKPHTARVAMINVTIVAR